MNRTIIITAGTSAKTQALAKTYLNDQVIFADSAPVPQTLVNSGKFIQLPAVTASHFIHELLKACLDKDANLLILKSEAEIQTVLPERILFEEYNIEILC